MRTMHVCATKNYLIQNIRKHGARAILIGDWESDDEAVEAVIAHPTEFIVVGACDNRGEDGRCEGHETADLGTGGSDG